MKKRELEILLITEPLNIINKILHMHCEIHLIPLDIFHFLALKSSAQLLRLFRHLDRKCVETKHIHPT